MPTLTYWHLDVFTDRLFGGNQLAVCLDPPADLPEDTMQAIAQEMAFAETTFVFPAAAPGTDCRVRIFTPARELPMATKSVDLWERFTAESGEQTGFRRCGLFYVSNDEQELATWASWREFARTAGVTTHMLTAEEATSRAGVTGRKWRGGVFSPSDGIANPGLAAPAVAKALMKLGGTVHQGCAARGIETAGGGVTGVVTEKGTIRTSLAIMAGGAWASSSRYVISLP